jgi:hypothetical protein
MRSIASELGLAVSTVRKKMLQDISYKRYTFLRDQFMNAATKETRFTTAKMLLNKLKVPSAHVLHIS